MLSCNWIEHSNEVPKHLIKNWMYREKGGFFIIKGLFKKNKEYVGIEVDNKY